MKQITALLFFSVCLNAKTILQSDTGRYRRLLYNTGSNRERASARVV